MQTGLVFMVLKGLNVIYEIRFRISGESVPVQAEFRGTEVWRELPCRRYWLRTGTRGNTSQNSDPRWLTDIYKSEIQPVTLVPT